MRRKREMNRTRERDAAPAPEASDLLCRLSSPDEAERAKAVRSLCPCRLRPDIPVAPAILAMRSDPSPMVRAAVNHDLLENKDWGVRVEARRLDRRRNKRRQDAVQAEIDAGPDAHDVPGPHSFAWYRRPRPKTGRRR